MNPPYRSGHSGVGAILDDIFDVLPPNISGKSEYQRCHTTFGLMQAVHYKAKPLETPDVEQKELSKLEPALRARTPAAREDVPRDEVEEGEGGAYGGQEDDCEVGGRE
ncbi:hypothetical protein BCR34DRAFT_607809 [Clohesyomyces aquaticus]|uniref:Uncharacterized protein n=1 Tax=Clohesyomyces aquaticus TaxID=1231657 RepID=A0A1Y1YD86_9PLEO|nr:hypothetical protein BCR34DRAFT_607809 [Clohesyomyces aquaticus]